MLKIQRQQLKRIHQKMEVRKQNNFKQDNFKRGKT